MTLFIDGIKGEAVHGSAQSSYPVTVIANFPNGVSMRFGNTLAEAAIAPWRDYEQFSTFYMRTGNGTRRLFAQFKNEIDEVETHCAEALPYYEAQGKVYEFPVVNATGHPGFFWKNDFTSWFEHWVGYTFDATGPNIFYPATWFPNGGVDDAPFIRVDASRWNNDSPETPDSCLMLLTYFEWSSGQFVTDLYGKTWKFYLRGVDLNLYDGSLGAWAVDTRGRYWKEHNTAPVVAPNGFWSSEQSVSVGTHTDWVQSYPESPSMSFLTDSVRSIGIGARNYSKVPTGAIDLCSVTIEAS